MLLACDRFFDFVVLSSAILSDTSNAKSQTSHILSCSLVFGCLYNALMNIGRYRFRFLLLKHSSVTSHSQYCHGLPTPFLFPLYCINEMTPVSSLTLIPLSFFLSTPS